MRCSTIIIEYLYTYSRYVYIIPAQTYVYMQTYTVAKEAASLTAWAADAFNQSFLVPTKHLTVHVEILKLW